MTLHVLTGDALLASFPARKLEGSVAICRECLIEGPVRASDQEDFWTQRELYLSETYPESDINYPDEVVFEFDKLKNLQDGDEVNLWFEHDLFCQVNLWFVLSLLPQNNLSVYRIIPPVDNPEHLWHGFGPMSSKELLHSFSNRVLLSNSDIELGKKLWRAYSSSNMEELEHLSSTVTPAFSYLQEVCKAQVQRIPTSNQPSRPEKVLQEIMENGDYTFEDAFQEFSDREGIYGFGDLQVKRIYDQLTK